MFAISVVTCHPYMETIATHSTAHRSRREILCFPVPGECQDIKRERLLIIQTARMSSSLPIHANIWAGHVYTTKTTLYRTHSCPATRAIPATNPWACGAGYCRGPIIIWKDHQQRLTKRSLCSDHTCLLVRNMTLRMPRGIIVGYRSGLIPMDPPRLRPLARRVRHHPQSTLRIDPRRSRINDSDTPGVEPHLISS